MWVVSSRNFHDSGKGTGFLALLRRTLLDPALQASVSCLVCYAENALALCRVGNFNGPSCLFPIVSVCSSRRLAHAPGRGLPAGVPLCDRPSGAFGPAHLGMRSARFMQGWVSFSRTSVEDVGRAALRLQQGARILQSHPVTEIRPDSSNFSQQPLALLDNQLMCLRNGCVSASMHFGWSLSCTASDSSCPPCLPALTASSAQFACKVPVHLFSYWMSSILAYNCRFRVHP